MRHLLVVLCSVLLFSSTGAWAYPVTIEFEGVVEFDNEMGVIHNATYFAARITFDTDAEPTYAPEFPDTVATFSHTPSQFDAVFHFGRSKEDAHQFDATSLSIRLVDDRKIDSLENSDTFDGFSILGDFRAAEPGGPYGSYYFHMSDAVTHTAIDGLDLADVPLSLSEWPTNFFILDSYGPDPGFSVIYPKDLRVVPEQSVTLLFAAGLVGLAAAGRGSRRG